MGETTLLTNECNKTVYKWKYPNYLAVSKSISVGGEGQGATAPSPSWTEIHFTHANFLKKQ